MSATPLYRGQGNKPFETAKPVSAAKRGQTVPYDVNGAPAGGTGGTGRTLYFSIMDMPQASGAEPLVRDRLREKWTFNGAASVADSAVAGAGASVFSIRKNSVQVGTVTFAGASTTGTIAFTDSIFPAGSLFELWPPSAIDGVLDRVSISFAVSIG
jgi:hypothetical protein